MTLCAILIHVTGTIPWVSVYQGFVSVFCFYWAKEPVAKVSRTWSSFLLCEITTKDL